MHTLTLGTSLLWLQVCTVALSVFPSMGTLASRPVVSNGSGNSLSTHTLTPHIYSELNAVWSAVVSWRIRLQGRPPSSRPGPDSAAIYTVSPFIGTNLLKATIAFITCQTTQVQRSNLALFVFALLLDYCVFVALLNRLAIQQLHLDLGIPRFFPAFAMKHQLNHTWLLWRRLLYAK